jgi:hypothetical protein
VEDEHGDWVQEEVGLFVKEGRREALRQVTPKGVVFCDPGSQVITSASIDGQCETSGDAFIQLLN